MSRDISPAERELELDEYHHMFGTFGDYKTWYLYMVIRSYLSRLYRWHPC